MACGRPSPPSALGPPGPDAGVAADPVVAEVDLDVLRWSQVDERLRALAGQPEAEVRALALAASDVLVVREMKVVGGARAATETAAQAADRFVASVWNGSRGCAVSDDEIRLAYLQNLARYKHPPGWTVWQAQTRCCGDGASCPHDQIAACLAEEHTALTALADALRADFRAWPVGPAAGATLVTLATSPLRDHHLPAFERGVADLQARGHRRIELVRYSFWQRGVAGFPDSAFRHADPAVERAASRARIGEVIGPLRGEAMEFVAVVAARQPLALGLPKNPTSGVADDGALRAQLELRAELCAKAAVDERQAYRERLLGGARLVWREAALRGRIGDRAIERIVAVSRKGR